MMEEAKDLYFDRRLMPRVSMNQHLGHLKYALLASGDLDYIVRYGIPLIASHQSNAPNIPLIVNCVDCKIKLVNSLMCKALNKDSLMNVFYTKSDFSNMPPLSNDQIKAFLRTIRYEVGRKIQKLYNCSLFIIDIDSIIGKNLELRINELEEDRVDFAIGSTEDILSKSMYEVYSKIPHFWKVAKAGFAYFSGNKKGFKALEIVSNSLFNHKDKVPAFDSLKLYRVYYGDQLALLFAALILNSAPESDSYYVKCIGHDETDMVSFKDSIGNSSIWIPPESKRCAISFDATNYI